jgi:hypothetical protein
MCTVLLPPGDNPMQLTNISYHIKIKFAGLLLQTACSKPIRTDRHDSHNFLCILLQRMPSQHAKAVSLCESRQRKYNGCVLYKTISDFAVFYLKDATNNWLSVNVKATLSNEGREGSGGTAPFP